MRLVTRAELARHLGLTTNAVTVACRERIKDACVRNRVDIDHPLVAAWITKQARKRRHDQALGEGPAAAPEPPDEPTLPLGGAPQPGEIVAAPRPRPAADVPPAQPQGIEDVEGFEDLTLREIVTRYGSMSVHSDWLDMRRKQTQIREREIKNYELEGKLIPRDAVRTHVFGAIDQTFRRLLQDFPKTMARRVYAMAKAGEPVEKAEDLARDALASQLKPMKEQAARALRSASSGNTLQPGQAPRDETTERG